MNASTQQPPTPEPLLPLPFPLAPRTQERPRLSLVIPVFNEEGVLHQTHEALAATLNELPVDWTIYFVNDGSRDGSVSVLRALAKQDARVKPVLLSRNFGHQAALTAGFDHADGDIIVCMDADLQHPPELLRAMLAAWRDGYDVVHTRKLVTEGLSGGRSLATRIAYALAARVSDVKIIPHSSDYRLLDRRVLDALKQLRERTRLYRGLLPWLGFRQCVLPFVAAKRAAGTSQYGLKQLVSLFTRAFFDFSNLPLYTGLFLGGVALAMSMIYFVFIVAWFLLGKSTPPGWASGVSVTLLLNSVTLAFCGIIGIYVARIYDEVRGRPTYVANESVDACERK